MKKLYDGKAILICVVLLISILGTIYYQRIAKKTTLKKNTNETITYDIVKNCPISINEDKKDINGYYIDNSNIADGTRYYLINYTIGNACTKLGVKSIEIDDTLNIYLGDVSNTPKDVMCADVVKTHSLCIKVDNIPENIDSKVIYDLNNKELKLLKK